MHCAMHAPKPPLPSFTGLWSLLWRAVVIAPLFVAALAAIFWTVASLALEQWVNAAAGGAVLAPLLIARRLLRRRCVIAARQDRQRAARPGTAFV
jgi:hypothetical protein